jgi:putative ABC transport system permease protein
VLTGVFDPPPETLSVPWVYLTLLVVAAVASTGAALVGAQAEGQVGDEGIGQRHRDAV